MVDVRACSVKHLWASEARVDKRRIEMGCAQRPAVDKDGLCTSALSLVHRSDAMGQRTCFVRLPTRAVFCVPHDPGDTLKTGQ
jgi:hypothetical protein